MSILTSVAHVDNDILKEVLRVLDVAVADYKNEIDHFTDILDPELTPEQFLPLLANFLGIESITGLSESDTRALLATLGTAYAFKGGIHGLRLVARALWRYASIVETYRSIYEQAVADPEGPEGLSDWQAWIEGHDIDVADLLEVVITTELSADDARRYGEKQAVEYQSLLDSIRQDSNYDKLFRTFRPGFDAAMSTTLGTSQFDEEGLLDSSFLLYGRNIAFLDPASQAILSALKWNIYPDFKEAASMSTLRHFLPLGVNVRYEATGYRQTDNLTVSAKDALSVASLQLNDLKLVWQVPFPTFSIDTGYEVTTFLANASVQTPALDSDAAATVAKPVYTGDLTKSLPMATVVSTGGGDVPAFTGTGAMQTPSLAVTADGEPATLEYELAGQIQLPWPLGIQASVLDTISYVEDSFQQHHATEVNVSSRTSTHITKKAQQDGNTAIIWIVTADGNNNGIAWVSNEGLTPLFTVDSDSFGDDISVFIEFPNWSAPGTGFTRTFNKGASASDQGVVILSLEVENIAASSYVHELETFKDASATVHDLDITVSENDLLLLSVSCVSMLNPTSVEVTNNNGFTIVADIFLDVAATTPTTVVGIKKANAGVHTTPELTSDVSDRRTVGVVALRSK